MLQHGKEAGASAGDGHCVKAAGAVGWARATGMLMVRRMLETRRGERCECGWRALREGGGGGRTGTCCRHANGTAHAASTAKGTVRVRLTGTA